MAPGTETETHETESYADAEQPLQPSYRVAEPEEDRPEAEEHQHPSDLKYAFIAAILAVITALEVGTHFLNDPSTTFLVASLIPMMVAKFVIVVGWFMHLRYDHRLFTGVFGAGLVLAVAVFLIMMAAMHFF